MKKFLENLLGGTLVAIVAAIIIGLFLGYAVASEAFVIYKFWEWFITPAFGNILPTITYVTSLGLSVFFVLIKGSNPLVKQYKWDELTWPYKLGVVFKPWIIFGIGFLVKCVMNIL